MTRFFNVLYFLACLWDSNPPPGLQSAWLRGFILVCATEEGAFFCFNSNLYFRLNPQLAGFAD
ncbi:MAG: hypothetical protein D3910_20970 [Candidatus Electrothrix sp. ATG2]|nr:hypothetical protein [Candidatus Electrothrix sp. ATG2]